MVEGCMVWEGSDEGRMSEGEEKRVMESARRAVAPLRLATVKVMNGCSRTYWRRSFRERCLRASFCLRVRAAGSQAG